MDQQSVDILHRVLLVPSLDSRAQVGWRLKESSQEETTSRPTGGDHTFIMITDTTHTTLAGQHNRSLADQRIPSMEKSQCAELHLDLHSHIITSKQQPGRMTHTGRDSQGKSTKLDSCCLHRRERGGGGVGARNQRHTIN